MKKRNKLKNSQLIVVDVTNHCCAEKSEFKPYGITYRKIRKMVPKLRRFIKRYKELTKQPVIYIKCVKWDKQHVAANIRKLYDNPNISFYTDDKTKFCEQFYLLEPKPEDIVITKNNYNAFTNPALNKLLQKRKIKNIVIAGVFGDGCVDATIQGGFSLGYNFIILKDLIETMDNPKRQQLQKLMKQYTWPVLYGETINSNQLIKI